MATPLSLRRRIDRKFPRVVKTARQWARAIATGRRPPTRVVFVIGSQRSGTRLPLQVLEHSPDVAAFSEGSAPFFDDVLLQPLDRIESLLRRSPAPVVVLKPICETHRIPELLERFPGAKAVWIFRNYQDAVNSASVKWSSGREALARVAAGSSDWRAGGLGPDKLELVRRLYRTEMTLHEANAVMWYLRNGLFFDLHVDTRPDVLLVRYEDLVDHPRIHVVRMFDFLDMPVPAQAVEAIQPSRRGNRSFPTIAEEIRSLCEGLHNRLLAHHLGRPGAAEVARTSRAAAQ
jgi:hypothetical protein